MKLSSKPKDQGGWDDDSAEEDMLLRFMGMSTEMKLCWLEEANRFFYRMASPRARELWGKFRRQEI
jgi:hypothetical protein